MTRALLQWSDIRPTLLRAQGRSGAEYEIKQTDGGRWVLWLGDPDTGIQRLSDGWLADMKALAEAHEADALGPAPEPQRIAWAKESRWLWWGVAPSGRAYRLLKVGDTWQLEQFASLDAKAGTALDEGPLAAMKAAAQRDATAAAAAPSDLEPTA